MTQESTVANADLWTRYFQDEWSRWGTAADSSVSAMAEGTAARVASFLTLVAAGPIAWLYNANSPELTPIREEVATGAFVDDAGHEVESFEETAA
jgi:hypothetical protein